jgi:predicted RNA binding protein YcfA (HicA-like mRNA interferase family)
LERNGWILDRSKGSHRTYKKYGYCSVQVPVHSNKELKRGTLKQILKVAGISESMLAIILASMENM